MFLNLFNKLKEEHRDNILYSLTPRTERTLEALQWKRYLKDLTIGESHDLFCLLFPNKEYDLDLLYSCFNIEKVEYNYEEN